MKIVFIRHGESTDDIDNQYGGWGDFHLTKKGKSQIKNRSLAVKKLNIKFDKIYYSPLLRAKESVQILSNELGVEKEALELVKEMNRNGILSGLERTYAQEKYPDQVANLEASKFVLASERYEDFVLRVKRSVEFLLNSGHENLLVVTHGNYLRCLTKEIFHDEIKSFGDGGIIVTEIEAKKARITYRDLVEN